MSLESLIPQKKFSTWNFVLMLKKLFPRGPLWNFDLYEDTTAPLQSSRETWSRLLHAFAEELSRFDDAILNLIKEAVPGLAEELLPDWEKMLGLPDVCSQLATTVPERQAVAHAKYTNNYTGLSAAFFTQYAASLGSTITVIEGYGGGTPFRVNSSRVDRTEDGVDGARLWSVGIYHSWAVQISSSDPNKNYLKCYFDKIKPAHTILVWLEV